MTYEELDAPNLTYQPSSELSRIVRQFDKRSRTDEARKWRKLRQKDPVMTRKIWAARRRARIAAVEAYLNTQPATGLAASHR